MDTTAKDTAETEAPSMRWERRYDVESGRIVCMWLLVADGTVIAELSVEDQRYRGFPDSFLTLLKDEGWVYENTWNVLGQFDTLESAVERAREEIAGSNAAGPGATGMELPVSASQQAGHGEEGMTRWYRRRDFEGGKELAVWQLYNGTELVESLIVESNAYKRDYTGEGFAAYVWRVVPDQDRYRDENGVLSNDPAEWINLTPFDEPHRTDADAFAAATAVLQESDHPVEDGPL